MSTLAAAFFAGRVTFAIAEYLDEVTFHGAHIDEEGVDWPLLTFDHRGRRFTVEVREVEL